jgi:hypothetical protein
MRMWKSKTLSLLVGMEITSTMEINMDVPQKTENRTTSDAGIPLLTVYPKMRSFYQRAACSPCL